MTSMVEKVARAIRKQMAEDATDAALARAAIAAMREPNGKMSISGVSGIPEEDCQTWRQFIDAALAEEPSDG